MTKKELDLLISRVNHLKQTHFITDSVENSGKKVCFNLGIEKVIDTISSIKMGHIKLELDDES